MNQVTDSGNAMPLNNPMVNNIGNLVGPSSVSTTAPSNWCQNPKSGTLPGIPEGDGTIDPHLLAIQQMRALEPIGWKGGDKHYDGIATFFPPFNMILRHIQ